jgi:hypothetical protein
MGGVVNQCAPQSDGGDEHRVTRRFEPVTTVALGQAAIHTAEMIFPIIQNPLKFCNSI